MGSKFGKWLGVVLALAASAAAQAGAGAIQTQVTPLSTTVTYSLSGPPALTTYIGYEVRIANSGGNTINNIRFTGLASIGPGRLAVFDSVEGASCTATNADRTAISCSLGQLQAGRSANAFVVFFKAPLLPAACPLPPAPCILSEAQKETVSFAGTTYYAEGTGGANSVPDNSTGEWSAAAVALGTANASLVRSSVPKAGGSFFTGTGSAATAADPWLTRVVVPAAAAYTTSVIAETSFSTPLASNLYSRESTELEMPGAFASLTIVLRRDVSTIAPSAKISNARVYYAKAVNGVYAAGPGVELFNCSAAGPAPGVPCIQARTEYTRKNAPSAAWEGDWEFVILALDNGRYIN